MKNNMVSDFDKEKAALRQEFNDLKTRIDKVTSRTLLITMLANAGSLFLRASELGIDFNISELLVSAESKVKFYENEIAQDNNRQDAEKAEEQKRLEEGLAEAQKQKSANEKREAELKQHIAEYTSEPFQKKFDELLKEEDDLLEKAAKDPNSLTAQEKARLMGQYASEKEKEEAEKKQQELSQYWEKHYAIKDEVNKSIKYRQGQIKINEVVINHPSTPEHVRSKAHQDNAVHNQKTAELKEDLKVFTPKEQKREEDRRKILALVKSGPPELAIERLKDHHKYHIEEYDQVRQQYPNHQGYHELHSMIMELGGHEQLGLPKPKYPVQQQPIASSQNIKDSSVVQHPAETIERPVAQATKTPKEQAKAHAQSVRDSLEQSHLLPQQSNTKVKPKNSQPNIDAVVSKDQGQGKGVASSAMSKFLQRQKAMEWRG